MPGRWGHRRQVTCPIGRWRRAVRGSVGNVLPWQRSRRRHAWVASVLSSGKARTRPPRRKSGPPDSELPRCVLAFPLQPSFDFSPEAKAHEDSLPAGVRPLQAAPSEIAPSEIAFFVFGSFGSFLVIDIADQCQIPCVAKIKVWSKIAKSMKSLRL